jgi:hypothetical protein
MHHGLMKLSAFVISLLAAAYFAVFQTPSQALGTTLIGIGAITSPIMIFALGIIQLTSNKRAEAARRRDEIARKEVADKVESAASAAQEVARLAATRAEAARVEVSNAADAAREVARVAAEVAKQAEDQSAKILVLADKTHTLVNSQYGIALALILEKAMRIAELSNTQENRDDVVKARQKLADHEAKQHVVDSKLQELRGRNAETIR